MIEVIVPAAVAVVGLLWLVRPPRVGVLVPGGLVFDERIAAQHRPPSDASSCFRDGTWTPSPRHIAEARILGLAFGIIGILALFSHPPVMLVVATAVVVLYAAIVCSASARVLHSSARRGWRFRLDRVTLLAMLGPMGSAVILTFAPFFTGRFLAVVVVAVVAVIGYVHAVANFSDVTSPLERTLAERWRSALDYTAIGAANITALAYAVLVLNVGEPFAVALTGWSAVSTALLVYYARTRFAALNEEIQSALK
jgi:hypothetical protein